MTQFLFFPRLENQLAEAQKDHDTRQLQLNKAYCELNKRITEHDKCMAKNVKTDITLQVIHFSKCLKLKVMKGGSIFSFCPLTSFTSCTLEKTNSDPTFIKTLVVFLTSKIK